jgi:8-oxo-dGTP diphosphatase
MAPGQAGATGPQTVYLVRHAHAGIRGDGPGYDYLRPLSPLGWRQAWALVDRLGPVPMAGLLTSPYVRCRQTLEPLARAWNLPIRDAGSLAEGAPTAEVLRVLATVAGGPLVLCSHGDIIERALEHLFAAGMWSDPDDRDRCEKGSIWVLTRDGGSFVRGHYLPPVPAAEVSVSEVPAG